MQTLFEFNFTEFDLEPEFPRSCVGCHSCFFVECLVRSIPIQRRAGFVYAGVAANGLVKIGKSIRQCPLCRMDQNSLEYTGIVWVDDASVFEQQLLARMGVPTVGDEWFNDTARMQKMIRGGWLHDVVELEKHFVRQFG